MAKITEAQHQEKAVFVGVIKQGDEERQVMEYLDELEFLADPAGSKERYEIGRASCRERV